MAIRIEHQAAAGLTGAFAAGQSASRRRGQRYILDLSRDRLRYQQRLGGRLGVGRRAGAAQAPQGRWDDPLAAGAGTVAGNAAIARRDRLRRAGRADPANEPVFVPQEQIEAEAAIAKRDEGRGFEAGQEAAERRRETIDDDIGFARKDITEGKYSKADAQLIEKKIKDINAIIDTRRISDPAARAKALDTAIGELDDLRGRKLKALTPDEKIQKGHIQWDPATRRAIPWGIEPPPGSLLVPLDENDNPVISEAFDPNEAANAAKKEADDKAEKAAEKQEKKQEAAQDKFQKRSDRYQDMLIKRTDAIADRTNPGTKKQYTLAEAGTEAKKQLAVMGIEPPVAPVVEAPAAAPAVAPEPGQFGNEQVPSDEAILGDLVPDAPPDAVLRAPPASLQDTDTFTPPQPGQPVPRPDLMRLGTVEERKAAYGEWQQDVAEQKDQQRKYEEYKKDPGKVRRRHMGEIKMRRDIEAGAGAPEPTSQAVSLSPKQQRIQSEVKSMEHEMATLIELKNAGIATPEDEFKLQHLMDRRKQFLDVYKRLK